MARSGSEGRPTVVSLFSGCGGMDYGFAQRGFEIVYASDIDPAAVDCYSRNIDGRVFLRDATTQAFRDDIESIGSCEVVLGGFPCQGFSKAGPKDPLDARNTLYEEMISAVAILRPLVFVAENVDGVAQNFKGSFLKRIVEEFAAIGYRVDHRVIDAASFGLPQHRRRVFFVGTRQDVEERFSWPLPTHLAATRNGEFRVQSGPSLLDEVGGELPPLRPARTIREAIGDLVEIDPSLPDHRVTERWPAGHERIFSAIGEGQKLCNSRNAETSVKTWEIPSVFGATSEKERILLGKIARNRRRKKYGRIPNGNPLSEDEIARLAGYADVSEELESLVTTDYLKKKLGGYDLKGAMFCSGLFKRPGWDRPSPTVLTNFHNPRYFLHPSADRPFSLRECARLQGFPDEFVFAEGGVNLVAGYRLVGNAVPPPVAGVMALQIARILRSASVGAAARS